MTKLVTAKIVDAYDWECPGCGESNLDDKTHAEAIHMQYDMDYVSVKCSACNGSYVIKDSLGWLLKFRLDYGGRTDNLKRIETTKPGQIKYTREDLTRHEADVVQCFLCGGYGKTADAIQHDARCAFSDPTVDHVYAGGKL